MCGFKVQELCYAQTVTIGTDGISARAGVELVEACKPISLCGYKFQLGVQKILVDNGLIHATELEPSLASNAGRRLARNPLESR